MKMNHTKFIKYKTSAFNHCAALSLPCAFPKALSKSFRVVIVYINWLHSNIFTKVYSLAHENYMHRLLVALFFIKVKVFFLIKKKIFPGPLIY